MSMAENSLPQAEHAQQTKPAIAPSTDRPDTTSYVLKYEVQPMPPPAHARWELWTPPLIALIGVCLTLVFKWRQDAKERKFAMKRELYLKVADAMHEVNIVLGLLSDPNQPFQETMMKFTEVLAPLSKAEVVATMPLVEALAKFKNGTGDAVGRIVGTRLEVDRLNIDIKTNKPHISQLNEMIQGNLAEQRRINIDGKNNDGRFERLQRDFEVLQTRQTEYHNENARNYEAIQQIVDRLLVMGMDTVRRLQPLQADILELIRQELEFKFDKKKYLELQQGMLEGAKDTLNKTKVAAEQVFKPDNDDR